MKSQRISAVSALTVAFLSLAIASAAWAGDPALDKGSGKGTEAGTTTRDRNATGVDLNANTRANGSPLIKGNQGETAKCGDGEYRKDGKCYRAQATGGGGPAH